MSFKLSNSTPNQPSLYSLRRSSKWISGTSPNMARVDESGRTLMEMLMVLGIIGLLSITAIKLFGSTEEKAKAAAVAKQIQMVAVEHQIHYNKRAVPAANRHTVKGPHGIDLVIEDGTNGNAQKYFWITVETNKASFCNALKDSSTIRYDFVTVDGDLDKSCPGTLAFYYRKNIADKISLMTYTDEQGKQHFCPPNAVCQGGGFTCSAGYYQVESTCQQCPDHAISCTDENTATECENGYYLVAGGCLELPAPQNENCGNNKCVIYDTETQMCKYACQELEYLESTGTQYIDTGIKTGNGIDMQIDAESLNNTTQYHAMGFYSDSSENCYAIFGSSTGKIQVAVNEPNSGRIIAQNYTWKNQRHLCRLNRGKLYIDGTYIGEKVPNITAQNNIWVGAINNIATHKGKIYAAKITDNGSLVRDFIPVLDPEGTPAMFDKVSGTVFYNAGSGTFDYGPQN